MAASGSATPSPPPEPQPQPQPQPQGDAIAVVDAAGRLLRWSPGAERLLGYPAGEVLGTAATDLLGDRADTSRFDTDRPGYLGSTGLRHRDGGAVDAALWATPLDDGWLLQADRGSAVRQTELDRALLNGARDLRRWLLPRRLSDTDAVDVAYRHLPARGPAGVGGAWYDYMRLSGARMALMVGDTAGDGLHAAAYMARLRTATRVLADQDLSPEEVLTGLDALVKRFLADFAVPRRGPSTTTCLFAIFDPIKQELSLASAGHPLPMIRAADQGARALDAPIGHPLADPGTPYERTTLPWTDGDMLILTTRGLAAADGDDHPRPLLAALNSLAPPTGPHAQDDPSALCDRLIHRLDPDGRVSDAVLMIARLRRLAPDRYTAWDLTDNPEEVGRARALVAGQLRTWGLEDLDFGTELMVSELVTNALRYGKPPIRLRLIRDQHLICEVLDSSSTSPHVRHAADTDEGGRGLYMVAQLADRWGTRYHDRGKTIWAWQPLPDAA
ncbi:SpoIIE family protein phosphatase [Kitasatospora sp. NPDC051984]|uniref:SpoIIE family protein phosphatase n=1 Tax=Kitasatospora sp. NPDC051984 TaxID=3364059 RepID=UPI0037C6B4B6